MSKKTLVILFMMIFIKLGCSVEEAAEIIEKASSKS